MLAVDNIPNRAKLRAGYKLSETPVRPDPSTYENRSLYLLHLRRWWVYETHLGEIPSTETAALF